ncbi:MAG: hypothetical protein J6M31_07670 [Bacteroidales bacterium]|nr:hypothetical protein [Bacteroidales bacterium]
MKAKELTLRYGISTLGLILVALGVGISIKSNLGIAPPSCPPTILNLRYTGISVGTFTWMMHLLFILSQVAILRKRFKLKYLMQIPAAFVFGYLCDGAIWLFNSIDAPATNYAVQILFSLAAVLITAVGIKLEVLGRSWMLAGDMTTAILADETRKPFGTVKVVFDVALVAITALLAWLFFGQLTGNGSTVVIREGTLILAILTGLCMRVTDPLLEKLFKPITDGFTPHNA